MFPILLKLGPITIRTYGLLVAIGFFLALHYVLYRTRKKGFAEAQILDIVLYSIIAGLLGSRITYVLFNWSYYARHPLHIIQIWEGGLVFYGGFFAGIIAVSVYYHYHRNLRLWELADCMAPAIALGHFFGRLGCFSAGCCYGLPTELPWGVSFSHAYALAPLHISLHPVQLYEAAANLMIFVVLDWFYRYKHTHGHIFGTYLFLYGIVRFHIELLRGDDRGGFLWGASFSQLIALLLIMVSLLILILKREPLKKSSMDI